MKVKSKLTGVMIEIEEERDTIYIGYELDDNGNRVKTKGMSGVEYDQKSILSKENAIIVDTLPTDTTK